MVFEHSVSDWNEKGVEAPEELKNTGFSAGYKPPAPYFNWFFSSVASLLKELKEKVLSLDQGKASVFRPEYRGEYLESATYHYGEIVKYI